MRLAWIMFGLAAAAPALAAPQIANARPNLEEALERADLDGDGVITRGEIRDHRNRQFDRFDRNHDGYLSAGDLPRRARRGGGDRLEAVIADFDANRDGRLSHAEFVEGPTRAFNRADRDRDNRVNPQELRDFQAGLAPRR